MHVVTIVVMVGLLVAMIVAVVNDINGASNNDDSWCGHFYDGGVVVVGDGHG